MEAAVKNDGHPILKDDDHMPFGRFDHPKRPIFLGEAKIIDPAAILQGIGEQLHPVFGT